MSKVISVYSRNSYKEFRLPAGEKRNHSITLLRKDFDISRDVRVPFEILPDGVFVKSSDAYRVSAAGDENESHLLSLGHEVRMITASGDKLILTLDEQPEVFHALSGFDLSGRDSVTIGRDQDNDICYSHLGYVSGKHAEIRRCQSGWVILDFSKNGVYVNTHRVVKSQELVYGDHVNIAGLHIILFDDVLTMYDAAHTAYVRGISPVSRKHETPGSKEAYEGRLKQEEDVQETDGINGSNGRMTSLTGAETVNEALPEFVSLSGVIKADGPEDIAISERWSKHRTYEHIKAVIGEGAGGTARTVDLHERYNGPHMLVAGTTGAGKSELLKSMILSFAMEYSPEDLNFVLVDFKGGGMANTLADIPHTAGCVTNLSGGEIERAMLAVKCEVKNRQIRLNKAGVNHIDDYIRLREAEKADRPMPHIMIVIDEYAELKKEKPDLMADLISIAGTGRSLGIHLVIATQRPEGNVDENIRSNVRTDICLRVQNKESSMDVLGVPDAAYISCPGRAYIKVGGGEVFEQFQTAFSDIEMTARIKALLAEASDSTGMKADKLWLDPLEKEIQLDDVLKVLNDSKPAEGGDTEDAGSDTVYAVAGMVDDPERRSRYPLAFRIPGAGNLAVVGMPASGKTTLLYTMLASLKGTDTDISILAFDPGASGKPEDLKVRRYVCGRDADEAEDFLDEIAEEIQERKTAGIIKPYKVIAVDSYEDLRDITGYSGEKKLSDMMREAESAGVIFIVTGGGFGLGQITGGAEKTIKTVLCLRQRSIYEYMDALHTKDISRVPDPDIRGRGMALIGGRAVEFQTAVFPGCGCGREDR